MPADEPDPPRRFYDFKRSDIKAVNAPVNETQASAPIRVQDLLRQAGSSKPGRVSRHRPAAPADSDVHALLRANLAQDNASGLNELKPIEKRPSRRKRDFWFVMISGNAFILLLIVALGGIAHPVMFLAAAGGIGLFSAALAWVMWFVMDDY